MTAVFVHGNPETAAIWRPMCELLDREAVTLSPPGFGAPTPAGWTATRAEYVEWLISAIEDLDRGPVDLVGHDWGGGHVMGVVLTRQDLIRSWCIDVAGIFHPDYVWHDMAQAWQTPDVGEQTIAAMLGMPVEERTANYVGLGMPDDVSRELAEALDDEMGRCILALYRDAAQPALADMASQLSAATTRSGLVVIASDDTYVGTATMAEATAAETGATVAHLTGVGHWWMLQDPAAGAEALSSFWAGLAN